MGFITIKAQILGNIFLFVPNILSKSKLKFAFLPSLMAETSPKDGPNSEHTVKKSQTPPLIFSHDHGWA